MDAVMTAGMYALSPGETTVTVELSPGSKWEFTTTYVNAVPTAWAVNSQGQTFGAPNSNGQPDLATAEATNGEHGYIYTDGTRNRKGARFLPVYRSDGYTVIGKIPTGVKEVGRAPSASSVPR